MQILLYVHCKGQFSNIYTFQKFLIATATKNVFTRNINKTMNERTECKSYSPGYNKNIIDI